MKVLIALSTLIAPSLLSAQSYPDPTFGTGGHVTLDIQGSFEQFRDMIVQPDGKIIAAGHANLSSETSPLIARFTSNGVLDPSFNGTGWATGPDTTWFDPGDYSSLALLPDGKILCLSIARPTLADYWKVLVARYLSNGTLDPSFGAGGYVLHGSPNDMSWYPNDMILMPGGGIRICGTTNENPDDDFEFLVLGLLSDGSLDPTFGIGGVVNFHPGNPNIDCEAYAMALQSDGRLVVATEGRVNTSGYVTIWGFRLNTDGTLDTSFGENGLVINYNDGNSALDVAVGPNDEVLLVGFGSIIGSYQDLVTMQLDADGNNPVETFYECASNESLMGQVAWIQDDGKAIAMGLNGSDAYILRRMSDGSLDPSFGAGGIVSETTVDISNSIDGRGSGFWMEENGRMLVCGRSGVVPGNGDDAIIMAFYPSPVGVNEVGSIGNMSISPNPAIDQIRIGVDESLMGTEALIELIDATGRPAHLQRIASLHASNVIDLPPSLSNGIYVLKMYTGPREWNYARVTIQR